MPPQKAAMRAEEKRVPQNRVPCNVATWSGAIRIVMAFGLCIRGMIPARSFMVVLTIEGIILAAMDAAVRKATNVATSNGTRILDPTLGVDRMSHAHKKDSTMEVTHMYFSVG